MASCGWHACESGAYTSAVAMIGTGPDEDPTPDGAVDHGKQRLDQIGTRHKGPAEALSLLLPATAFGVGGVPHTVGKLLTSSLQPRNSRQLVVMSPTRDEGWITPWRIRPRE